MTIDDCRTEARRRWGGLTPYRLGRVVAEFDAPVVPPYGKGSRSDRLYWVGVRDGQAIRRKGAQSEGGA